MGQYPAGRPEAVVVSVCLTGGLPPPDVVVVADVLPGVEVMVVVRVVSSPLDVSVTTTVTTTVVAVPAVATVVDVVVEVPVPVAVPVAALLLLTQPTPWQT